MKLGIITYNKPHLKTFHVLKNILNKNYEINIYTLPFKEREQRKIFFNHRPNQFLSKSQFDLAKKYKLKVNKINYDAALTGSDLYIICGAGLLKKKFINKNIIINCHSGILPDCRGLDSFKWSILKQKKVGVSLHIINEHTDSGYLLKSRKTNLVESDSLKQFAKKHYFNEIDLLSNFENYLDCKPQKIIEKNPPTMRMPYDIEIFFFNSFEQYKKNVKKNKI